MVPVPKVYVVDDHSQVRQALVARLRGSAGLSVAGETGDYEQALLEVASLEPDVIVVDPKRSDGRGLELLHHLARLPKPTRLILLTSYHSGLEEWEGLRLGAAAYVLKDLGTDALEAEIRRAAQEPQVKN